MSGIIGGAGSKSGIIGTLMESSEWEDLAFDTNYLATRDLFVVAYTYANSAGNGLALFTDASTTPSTGRSRSYNTDYYSAVSGVVKKGDYWRVYLQDGTASYGPFAIPLN